MKTTNYLRILVILIITSMLSSFSQPDWGFYGHRVINKTAVFTLPVDLIPFYKSNIDYLEEHAVDPDKRRYATKHEGVRHYIDIDVWGEYPFNNVPKDLDLALIKFSVYSFVNQNDTIALSLDYSNNDFTLYSKNKTFLKGKTSTFRKDFNDFIMPNYYEDEWIVNIDSLDQSLKTESIKGKLILEDHFSQDGILPYNLQTMKNKLTNAFIAKDVQNILRLSAEIGHYIGDAHVPLHTTVNYNGQLTNQVGIHGFWESRLPELFAESEYNFMVGKAEYISNTKEYFWKIVLESHSRLEEVLTIEKELSKLFPADQQYCYDDRLNQSIRTFCPEYANAYHKALQGMVEERMTDAIKSIGSIWYTCWIDAGQPDLSKLRKINITSKEIKKDQEISAQTRTHE